MSGTLYIVGTPIGNLKDISQRALETLKRVLYIACEDTRVTKKLLSHYEIKTKTKRVDMHSGAKTFRAVLSDLQNGVDVAVVTDAGMPVIADPGNMLVAYIARHDPEISIVTIPGPTALGAALSVSGFPADRFVFYGFAPAKKSRGKFFQEVANTKHTVVLYESKHRIAKTLTQLGDLIGDREVVVARELTKQFETVYRGSISQIMQQLNEKGEFVIVISPK